MTEDFLLIGDYKLKLHGILYCTNVVRFGLVWFVLFNDIWSQ